jgi:hypothetical protein
VAAFIPVAEKIYGAAASGLKGISMSYGSKASDASACMLRGMRGSDGHGPCLAGPEHALESTKGWPFIGSQCYRMASASG